MGLDLALGGLVLLVAFRGWLRGFLVPTIRLAGLVAAAYAAVPVRDFAKPYALQYLPSVRADLSDRLSWWVAGVVSYFVIVGVASLVVAASRRNDFGLPEKNRSDQFAGFGLGLLKGLLVASFLLAGVQRYGEVYVHRIDWAEAQTKESMAWKWSAQYQPARRIWDSEPVQLFVRHVQKNGLNPPASTPVPATRPEKETAEAEDESGAGPKAPLKTASRSPKLVLPGIGGPPIEVDTTGLADDVVRELESVQRDLSRLQHSR